MNLRERRRRQEEGSGAPPGRRGAGRRCSRALAASEAIGSAQSPHAGLQQQPPRIGARAGIHRGARERVRAARAAREPTDSGLGSPPSLMVTPPLFLRCKCCLWGSRQPQSRMLGPKERARRARSQLERPPRPPPSALRGILQHFALSRRSPPSLRYLHIPRLWPIRAPLSRSVWLLPERKGSGWRRMRRGGRLEPRLLLL